MNRNNAIIRLLSFPDRFFEINVWSAYAGYALIIVATLLAALMIWRWRGGQRFYIRLFLPAGLFIAAFMWSVTDRGWLFMDFWKAYFYAGSQVLIDPSQLYHTNALHFVNIPLVAVIFVPFAKIGLTKGALALAVLNILASAVACYLLIRHSGAQGWRKTAIIGLFLVNGPLYYNLRLGNTIQIILLLIVLALVCLEMEKDTWAGVILGCAAVVKLPLLLLGAYFLFRKHWCAAAAFAATLTVLVGTSILLFGISLHLTWFQYIGEFSQKPIAAYNVQCLAGLLARLVSQGSMTDWGFTDVPKWYGTVYNVGNIFLLGVTGIAIFRPRLSKDRSQQAAGFTIMVMLCFLISPLSWSHYYHIMLLPLSLFAGGTLQLPKGAFWPLTVGGGAFLLSLPVWHPGSDFHIPIFLPLNVLVSHYYIGGLLVLMALIISYCFNRQPYVSEKTFEKNKLG